MTPSGSGDPTGVVVLAAVLLAVLLTSALLLWRVRRATPALLVEDEPDQRAA